MNGGANMTWIIKAVERVPPEEKPVPSWVYALPLIGILLAVAKRRR